MFDELKQGGASRKIAIGCGNLRVCRFDPRQERSDPCGRSGIDLPNVLHQGVPLGLGVFI
jgi:hypothetical protein